MAAMDELETLLTSLAALKPPGVTKTKIDSITAICIQNVQSDSVIVHKVCHQFQKSAATHKLGVLYVVDSVARQWMEKARQTGQVVSKNAADGTFASGVQKVTDVLPTLMANLIQNAPDNQKDKISKLVDIWERGQTFPSKDLISFKEQLKKTQQKTNAEPGSQLKPQEGPSNPPVAGAILAAQAQGALLGHANFGTSPAITGALPAPTANHVAPTLPQAHPGLPPPPPQIAAAAQLPALNNELAGQLLQAIASGMIPPEQAMQLLGALAANQPNQPNGGHPTGAPVAPPPLSVPVQSHQPPAPGMQPQPAQRNGMPERYDGRYRDRSRSPDMDSRRRSPVNRRDSPTYDAYDPNSRNGRDQGNAAQNDRGGGRGRGKHRGRNDARNDYRQRTPPRRQPSPAGGMVQPRFIEMDSSLPPGHIRVLSRTLFVGGASGTEDEIRKIFSRFGRVQTCIVNLDKRHAFVKMVNRQDAVAAKEGMDSSHDPEVTSKARQTRWGVGFGPRDCSDYNVGVSVIPISCLTDADMKWVRTAEYGGTGGRDLVEGMVLEEPDIEIGAGVSSKAISKRMPPHSEGGRRGGNANQKKSFSPRGGHDRFRKSERVQAQPQAPAPEPYRPEPPRPLPRPAEVAPITVPPAVPQFGFQLPGM